MREKPFVTVFLPSFKFSGRYSLLSCYISKKTTQRVIKQTKQQFMHLISTKDILSRWVLTLKREKPFVTVILPSCQFCGRYAIVSCYISIKTTQRVIKQSKQQFVHLISRKEVLIRWVPTFIREKPFVTVFLPSCQFCGRYAIVSCYISKKTTQRVIKQSKQQFMHLISTKDVLSRWVPTLKREQPFAKQQFMH